MKANPHQIVLSINDEMSIEALALIVKAKRFIKDSANEEIGAILKKKILELDHCHIILFNYSEKYFCNYKKDIKVIKEFFSKIGEINVILELYNSQKTS
jgi:hypothetical protein